MIGNSVPYLERNMLIFPQTRDNIYLSFKQTYISNIKDQSTKVEVGEIGEKISQTVVCTFYKNRRKIRRKSAELR